MNESNDRQFTIDSQPSPNVDGNIASGLIDRRFVIYNIILSSLILIFLIIGNITARECIPYIFKTCGSKCIAQCGDWGIAIIGFGFILLLPAILQTLLAFLNLKIRINRWLWLFVHLPMIFVVGFFGLLTIFGVLSAGAASGDFLSFAYLLIAIVLIFIYIYLVQAKIRKLF